MQVPSGNEMQEFMPMPGNVPLGIPGSAPEMMQVPSGCAPGMMQGVMPGMMPGMMQDMMPGMMPGMMQGCMESYMPEFMQHCMPGCMQGMAPQCQNCPMMAASQQQLEALYPRTYHIVQPAVDNACDMMVMTYGTMSVPTREQMDAMADDICKSVENDVDAAVRQNPGSKSDERQLLLGGRRLLRDLVLILLIRGLIRRRRPFFGFGF